MTTQLTIEGVPPPPAQGQSVLDFRYDRHVKDLARDYDKALAAIERAQDEVSLLTYNVVEMRAVLEAIANDTLPSCSMRNCVHPACDLVVRYRTEARDALLRIGGTVHHE